MPYPDDLLTPDERVVVHKHPHWKMLILPILAFLVIAGAGGFLIGLVSGEDWEKWGFGAIAIIGGALLIWLVIVPLIRWRTTHFVVTNRRVLVREGVLSRSGIDIPVNRISSVQFRHSILERIVGCGTLVIESASDEPLEFDDIPKVERVHSILYQQINPQDSRREDHY